METDIYLIGGPTASGKTARAVELAQKTGGVIINTDAMQIYRDLPILTAQPSEAEKESAPHRLFEIFAPSERSSAGRWLDLAKQEIARCLCDRTPPIFVGGTGLYFAALEGGLADIPAIPQHVRDATNELMESLGPEPFRELLRKIDPQSAAKIKPNDRQRLARAYDVAIHTGKPLPFWQSDAKAASALAGHKIHRVLLLPEREKLYAACDARFQAMMERGAMEEAQKLMEQNLPPDLPALKILGVPELTAALRGEIPLAHAISLAQQSTRNYAKRQVTWFKNQWAGKGAE